MKLADAFKSGRTTNLDALRLVLAACVIVSHAWPLAVGPGTLEPLMQWTGRTLGGWAVVVFFFLSGLLVTVSAERRSAYAFWRARIQRIFPGLAVALLTTLTLAFASGATADLKEAASWFMRALTLVSIEHRISGAFASNPYAGVVNGPLWSLFHEILAYGICMVFVSIGGARRPAFVLGLVFLAGMASLWSGDLSGRAATFLPLFFAFSLGMTAYFLRNRLELKPQPGFVFVLVASLLPTPVAVAAVCYAVLCFTFCVSQIRVRADYSYGLYIYGWPVAQFLVFLQPGIAPVSLAILSLVATLPFAMASWYFVERPAISRSRVQV